MSDCFSCYLLLFYFYLFIFFNSLEMGCSRQLLFFLAFFWLIFSFFFLCFSFTCSNHFLIFIYIFIYRLPCGWSEAQYFITSSKHNLISRSTWGLVWQYLEVHHRYYKWAILIRYEASIYKLISIHSFVHCYWINLSLQLTALVMKHVKALYRIKPYTVSPAFQSHNLANPSQGKWFKIFKNCKDV